MNYSSLICWGFVANFVLLTSCASNKNRETAQIPSQQAAVQVTDDCSNTTKPSLLRELLVKQQDGGSSVSLCDIAKQSAAVVNILFLTSPACTTCKPALKSLNRIGKQNVQYNLFVGVPAKSDSSSSLAYTIEDAKSLANRSDVLDDSTPSIAKPILDVEGNIWVNSTVGSTKQSFPHALFFNAVRFQPLQEEFLILGKRFLTQGDLDSSLVQEISKFATMP